MLRRLGRNAIFLGSLLVALGIGGLILTMHETGATLAGWQLAPWFFVAGFGSGMVISPNVTLVLAGVPRQDAGSASGVLSATQRLGQAIGICLVGIALFGGLQTGANSASAGVTGNLRTELVAAHMPADQIDPLVETFTACFEKRAYASDPTAVPTGCPVPDANATDPVSIALEKAAGTALANNFSSAAQQALFISMGLVVITFFLVFALPRRVAANHH
ncbi:MAG: hypothetical protein ACR2OU_11435 [Thermomicrobiales bacterium]